MTSGFEPDPAFEHLRRDHRHERAPTPLRERLLERLDVVERRASETPALPRVLSARWRAPLGFGLAAALLALVWMRLPTSGGLASGRLGPEPIADAIRTRPAEPRLAADIPTAPPRPCPLEELLGGLAPDALADTPPPPTDADRWGLSWRTLRLPTPSCGSLPRHFLQLVPPGTPPIYRGPVLILLPGMGSPESLAIETRWYFEGLAREKQAVTVYAKALQEPRPSTPSVLVGGWQTDTGAHPQVDDHEYLDRIILDLSRRGIIGGGNEIWLVGKGSGAVMALAAAAHHPERYTGVAALSPQRLDIRPKQELSRPRMARRLSRVLFMIEGAPDDVFRGELETSAKQWARALGVTPSPSSLARRAVTSPRVPGLHQIDIGTAENGAPGVRILTLDPGLDPFPPPGAADPVSLAASRQRPHAINGAEEVWKFLGGE